MQRPRQSPLLLLFLAMGFFSACSSPSDPVAVKASVSTFSPFSEPDSVITLLKALNALESDTLRVELFEQVWKKLSDAGQIPLRKHDKVLFLYRGDAHNVRWNGAFNKWGEGRPILGSRLFKLNVWYATGSFDTDARLEYKIVLNSTNWFTQFFGWKTEWIFDPANPHRRPGGFGPDSELIMPEYKPHVETFERFDVAKGTLTEPEIISSDKLGYPVRYQVYLPFGYEKMKHLPVVYVTDGHEYASQDMGRMTTVLDNAIADGSILPLIAVLIDPRDVKTGENRRMTEFSLNESFAAFLAEEMVLLIDVKYRTAATPGFRAIMGTSLGGLNAAWAGFKYPDVFGNLAIHSPAFWYREQILELYRNSEVLPLKIHMVSGTVNDTEEHARKMHDILQQKGYPVSYHEYHESHSWGLWSGVIDDPLQFFWGKAAR
jgi:enterochelin esterase family protein